jgi:DnaJ-class molecular chaperone
MGTQTKTRTIRIPFNFFDPCPACSGKGETGPLHQGSAVIVGGACEACSGKGKVLSPLGKLIAEVVQHANEGGR